MGENHEILSYISKYYINREHQLPNSPALTRRRLQPKGRYNSLDSLAPTGRRL
jgi:hypothetical protein